MENLTLHTFLEKGFDAAEEKLEGFVGKGKPVVSVLSSLIKTLLPGSGDDDKTEPFKKIQGDVAKMMAGKLDTQKITDLLEEVEGLQGVLARYEQDLAYGDIEKVAALEYIVGRINELEPAFLSVMRPDLALQTLPMFVTLGSLKLAALREYAFNYDALYRPDIYSLQGRDAHTRHQNTLLTAVSSYCITIRKVHAQMLDWRRSQFWFREWQLDSSWHSKAVDKATDWVAEEKGFVYRDADDGPHSQFAVRRRIQQQLADKLQATLFESDLTKLLTLTANKWATLASTIGNGDAKDVEIPMGTKLWSPSRKAVFYMQEDRNTCTYTSDFRRLFWNNKTSVALPRDDAPYKLVLKQDGDLVGVNAANAQWWSSNTKGKGVAPYRLELTDEGVLSLVDGTGTATWSSPGSGAPEPVRDFIKDTVYKSPGGKYGMVYGGDRYVRIFALDAKGQVQGGVVWQSDYAGIYKGQAPFSLRLQADGEFVGKDAHGVWFETKTAGWGVGPYRLDVTDDADIIIHDSRGVNIWSRKTPGQY